jgi:hypothetical protein
MLADTSGPAFRPLWRTHRHGCFRITQFFGRASAGFIPPLFIFRRIRDRTK